MSIRRQMASGMTLSKRLTFMAKTSASERLDNKTLHGYSGDWNQ